MRRNCHKFDIAFLKLLINRLTSQQLKTTKWTPAPAVECYYQLITRKHFTEVYGFAFGIWKGKSGYSVIFFKNALNNIDFFDLLA
jgi:hypothetical protein